MRQKKFMFAAGLGLCLALAACAAKAPLAQRLNGTWELFLEETLAHSPTLRQALAENPEEEAAVRAELENFRIEFQPGKALLRGRQASEYTFTILSEPGPDGSAAAVLNGERLRLALNGDRLYLYDLAQSEGITGLTLVFRRLERP